MILIAGATKLTQNKRLAVNQKQKIHTAWYTDELIKMYFTIMCKIFEHCTK